MERTGISAPGNVAKVRNSWLDPILFAGRALLAPRRFGALLPSGYELGEAMARLGKGSTLVELGPGSGSITRHILRGLPWDGKVLGLELDPGIAYLLQKSLPDPRLQVRIGDAGDLREWLASLGWAQADAVISGLPLQIIPPQTVSNSRWRDTEAGIGRPLVAHPELRG